MQWVKCKRRPTKIESNAWGWELIINIVVGIMPQTIQLDFYSKILKDTIQEWESYISSFYICIYSNWNIFSITFFVYLHFFVVVVALITFLVIGKQTRNMRFENSMEKWHKNVYNFQFIFRLIEMKKKILKQSITNLKLHSFPASFSIFKQLNTWRNLRKKNCCWKI